MNYASIDAQGNVVNISLWDGVSKWTPSEGLIAVRTDIAGIGWTYHKETGAFFAPETGLALEEG